MDGHQNLEASARPLDVERAASSWNGEAELAAAQAQALRKTIALGAILIADAIDALAADVRR
jgi:hypothetical protein